MKLIKMGQFTSFVLELAQFIIVKVTVLGIRDYEFEFMDGSVVQISI